MWLLVIKIAKRSIKNNCVNCRQAAAQSITPVMADLLDNVVRWFNNLKKSWSGLLWAFHCEYKVHEQKTKDDGVVTMRAVHKKLVLYPDTDICFDAIMQFIGRRVKPSTVIFNTGTIFVGAKRKLSEFVAAWNKEGIEVHLNQRWIRWKMNPPAAPHIRKKWVIG